VVTAVIPANSDFEDFTQYDVQFDIGMFTLYESQLQRAAPKFIRYATKSA